ncbi:xanthine dehydrogenase family protein molybdopterin-binding subunit [Thermodesulfobacteriota bacterium]
MSKVSVVGQRVPRIDGPEIVTGQAQYTVDIALPGMLTGKIMRSRLPHAYIRAINTQKAESLTGVLAVITAADTLKLKCGYRAESADEYGLAYKKVRYIGEQVAAVAAVDNKTAEEALSQIDIEYEELPAVFDPIDAMQAGAPVIHANTPDNVSFAPHFHWGNIDEGFRRSEYVREDTFITPAQIHCSLEPHAAVASFSGGKLTVWSTTQGPYALRNELSHMLGIPLGKVRVVKPYMGGGFGGKREMFASDFCAALLAIKTGRPVKIVYSRTEEFIASRQRHPMHITIKTGCLHDGTLIAKDCKVIADGGAYNSRGPGVLAHAGVCLASLYRIPHVRYQGHHVYTNKPVGGAFRGYGSLQVRFGDESQLDMIAEDLNIDPLELRLRNAAKPGDVSVSGRKITSCGLTECIQKVSDASDWIVKRKEKRRGRGIGIACYDYVSAFRTIYEYDSSSAIVRLNEDGSADVITGAADIGQGSNTTIALIAAEELGLSIGKINIIAADTQTGALDLGSYASRVTFVAGNAVKLASADAKDQLFTFLSNHWSVDKEKISCLEGKISVEGHFAFTIFLAEAVKLMLNKKGVFILGRGYYDAPSQKIDYKTGYGNAAPTYSFGAQVAEVEVDYKTGKFKVIRVVAASDCGKAINPLALEGQAEGSIVSGMGMTQYEQRLLDGGRTMNPNLLDYKIPTAMETPAIESYPVETIDPEGPFGAKGVSEGYQVPTAPAIVNAIYHATGIRFNELPITPDKILKALKAKGTEKNASETV